jgi:uncharacterized membrane protein YgcG
MQHQPTHFSAERSQFSTLLALSLALALAGCQTAPVSKAVADEAKAIDSYEAQPCAGILPLQRPRGSVTDLSDVLSPEELSSLEKQITAIEQARLAEVLIYIAPALPAGETLEELTFCAANAWGIGNATADDGIAIFLFMADRKIRIELGVGAAEAISDEAAGRIIEQNMAPLFRKGAYGDGLGSALRELKRLLVIRTAGGATV